MKTIILTNGTESDQYEIPEDNFQAVMYNAHLEAEKRGPGWTAREPSPPDPDPVVEPESEVVEDQSEPQIGE